MINCKQNSTCMVTKLEIWIQDYLGPVQWSSDSSTNCRKELEPDEAISIIKQTLTSANIFLFFAHSTGKLKQVTNYYRTIHTDPSTRSGGITSTSS